MREPIENSASLKQKIVELRQAIDEADRVVVGAGSGLSTSAGFIYNGERFQRLFPDFIEKYHFHDMYSAGFYPFATPEEQWAFWSRYIWHNRYEPAPKDTYTKLLHLLDGKDFFVITTNVDHQFQLAGFPKDRLFYTQGDYGLWQCSVPCHEKTYDNYKFVKQMVEQQQDMRIPSRLVPLCPVCGKPMSMNLRADDTFVEDEGWLAAAKRYNQYLEAAKHDKTLYLELGVGGNTPVIIKYPFWRHTLQNPRARYACINFGEAVCPDDLEDQSILINADIDQMLSLICQEPLS